jgi:hypothetical protein
MRGSFWRKLEGGKIKEAGHYSGLFQQHFLKFYFRGHYAHREKINRSLVFRMSPVLVTKQTGIVSFP